LAFVKHSALFSRPSQSLSFLPFETKQGGIAARQMTIQEDSRGLSLAAAAELPLYLPAVDCSDQAHLLVSLA
jgi:hypothetical protein